MPCSIAPKALTTPIAMAVSRDFAGVPGVTAIVAIAEGVTAAAVGGPVLKCFGVHDWRARTGATGVAGIGKRD